jgi:CDGSH-type Zn-finger protein
MMTRTGPAHGALAGSLQEISMKPDTVIAQKAPYPVEVEAGKSYWWCACGKSARQPFCDGSHKGSSVSPIEYKADASGKVWFCGCKQGGRGALCDGSHKAL